MTGRLPSLLVLGAPKAGTTSLAAWWDHHPQGYTAPEKEVGFFTVHFDRGLPWYRSRFAAAGPDQHGCDASPGYLYDDTALDRIATTILDARLLVVLREPVSRVWSHWTYNVAIGVEPRSFATVLREELADESVTPPDFPLGYLRGSRYLPRLREVVARFDPEQLLVLFTDDLQRAPAESWARVCRHAGVEVVPPPAGDVRNVGRSVRSRRLGRLVQRSRRLGVPGPVADRVARWNLTSRRTPMDPTDRRRLEERLHPELPALATWLRDTLGEELPATWSAPAPG